MILSMSTASVAFFLSHHRVLYRRWVCLVPLVLQPLAEAVFFEVLSWTHTISSPRFVPVMYPISHSLTVCFRTYLTHCVSLHITMFPGKVRTLIVEQAQSGTKTNCGAHLQLLQPSSSTALMIVGTQQLPSSPCLLVGSPVLHWLQGPRMFQVR
jgi:hypothetical protein